MPKIPKSQKSAFLGRKHVRFWQIDTQTEFFGQTKPSFTFLGKLEKVGGQILKIEKSKIQGKTREKVKKVQNSKFLVGSILALFSWSDPHDPKMGPHPPRQVGPTPGQFGPKSPVSASKSPHLPSSPTFGSGNWARFRPKRAFSLFSHKPMGGRLASPPPPRPKGLAGTHEMSEKFDLARPTRNPS